MGYFIENNAMILAGYSNSNMRNATLLSKLRCTSVNRCKLVDSLIELASTRLKALVFIVKHMSQLARDASALLNSRNFMILSASLEYYNLRFSARIFSSILSSKDVLLDTFLRISTVLPFRKLQCFHFCKTF